MPSVKLREGSSRIPRRNSGWVLHPKVIYVLQMVMDGKIGNSSSESLDIVGTIKAKLRNVV